MEWVMIDIISYLWSFTVAFPNSELCFWKKKEKEKNTTKCQGAIPLEATKLSGLFGSSWESALQGWEYEQQLETLVGRKVKDPRKGWERNAWQFSQGTCKIRRKDTGAQWNPIEQMVFEVSVVAKSTPESKDI